MLAIQALAFIAEEPDRMGAFLAATGIAPDDDPRARRARPTFSPACSSICSPTRSLLLAFADSAGLDPAEIARARRALGGEWERDLP